jgi:exodeoxyribonuclease-5
MTIQLSEEQENVITNLKDKMKTEQIQILAGPAGSGKSTCLSYLINDFPNFAVCAYTGKAANVLRRKGISDAQTIHSTIYQWEQTSNGKLRFRRKPRNKITCSGFFIDEASMVSEDIFRDLLSYNLPLVFIGDHAQLEPIGNGFNIMQKPDYILETIHRNASTIAKFANHLRQGNTPESFTEFDDMVQIKKRSELKALEAASYDQVICGYNKTRNDWNQRIRRTKAFLKSLHVGERLICLRNNKELGIFNGMQGTVTKIYKDKRIGLDTGEEELLLTINYRQLGADKILPEAQDDLECGYFDYGYCITTHKAQGDEWGSVCVMEEKPFRADGWDQKRWAYTAASRAKTKLLWCC